MFRMLTVFSFAILVSACQTASAPPPTLAAAPNPEADPNYKRPSDADAMAAARKMVSNKLKDPDSARFADLVRKNAPNARGESTDVICGMVNAKNSFGGYTGSRPFVYFVARKESNLADGGGDVMTQVDRTIVRNFCVGFPAPGTPPAPGTI